jgi:hypothetical protein
MRSATREARRTERQTRRTSERALREQQDRARQRLGEVRQRADDIDMRTHNAIITGVLPRIQGAVDSWCRKQVPMRMSMSEHSFHAATDFKTISIGIPGDQVSVDFLGDLRGLAYHEAGHLRKTLPYPTLVEAVANALGLTPADVENAVGVPKNMIHRAWNILEDQRMETAMVVDSKNLGRYYNVIVLTHVVLAFSPQIYCWLAAREHIDADVVEAARENMVEAHGEAECERIEDVVWSYVETTAISVMWEAVVQLARFLNANNVPAMGTDQHEFDGEGFDFDADDLESIRDLLEEGATPRPSDEAGGEEGEEGEAEEGEGREGESKSDQASREEQESEGAGSKPGTFRQRVKEALERAIAERNEDKNLTNDMRSFNEAMSDVRNHTPLPRVPTSFRNTSVSDMAEATRVNRSLRLLMEAARAEHAPSWQGGQRTGVLDVIRYKTRQPGDNEFFRNIAEGGDMHLPNLSVSVLLDGSGSMSGYQTDLGVAAYAIKTACDACEVPCTVTVFDTQAHLLWDAEDRPLDIPDQFCPLGGTDPSDALSVVDGQMHDKARHLVIVMTDGAWQGWQHKSLTDYQYPRRDMVVLFWNHNVVRIAGLESTVHARIDSLMEIPHLVRRYLVQSM